MSLEKQITELTQTLDRHTPCGSIAPATRTDLRQARQILTHLTLKHRVRYEAKLNGSTLLIRCVV